MSLVPTKVAAEFGTRFLPDVTRNEYGTPLINSAFEQVAQMASHRLLCYVNADIILLNDLIEAAKRIRFPRFLMASRRWNIDLAERWDFEQPDWEERLHHYVSLHGVPHPSLGGIDVYVFPRDGMIERVPPFAVGRPTWDHWFIYRARKELGIPVVDVSRVTTPIHQNHDYRHVPNRRSDKWEGPEGDRNIELLGHRQSSKVNLRYATHVMTPEALLPAYRVLPRELGFGRYLRWRLRTLPILVPSTKPAIDLLRWLARLLRGSSVTA